MIAAAAPIFPKQEEHQVYAIMHAYVGAFHLCFLYTGCMHFKG